MRYFKIPLFILVLLLLDAGAGFFLRPYYRAATLPEFEAFYSRYVDTKAPFDIVFFGDSRIQHGIDTPYLSSLCRCGAGNLAVSGSTIASTYYLLRDYLAYNTPKLVVLEAHWSRMVDQGAGSHLYPLLLEMLPLSDQADYALTSGDLGFVAEKILYSYRYRKSLPRLVSGAGPSTSTPQTNVADQFISTGEGLKPTADIGLQAFMLLHPYDLPPSQTELAYLERTLSLLKEKGIAVALLQPPEPLAAQRTVAHYAQLSALIAQTAAQHSVPFINLDDPQDPALQELGNFTDVLHASMPGTKVFTKKLWGSLQAEFERYTKAATQ
ncbi:MAG TPA: hypothetical protein VJJ20_01175 [Candidatus Paceibacterota bacterium]